MLEDWRKGQIRIAALLPPEPKARAPRARPKVWSVGSKRRGGTKRYGGEKVAAMITTKPAGRPGPAKRT